jgi:hypothetical protein
LPVSTGAPEIKNFAQSKLLLIITHLMALLPMSAV